MKNARTIFFAILVFIICKTNSAFGTDYTIQCGETKNFYATGNDNIYLNGDCIAKRIKFRIQNNSNKDGIRWTLFNSKGETKEGDYILPQQEDWTNQWYTCDPTGLWRIQIYCIPSTTKEWIQVQGICENPKLAVDPIELHFTMSLGSSNLPSSVLNLQSSSTNGTPLGSWSIVKSGSMISRMSVNPASGSGSGQVSVSVDGSGLTAGDYTIGTLQISSNCADDSPKNVPVYLTVATAKPGAFSLTSPASNATGIDPIPSLQWGSSSNATSYRVEMTGDLFGNPNPVLFKQTNVGNVTLWTYDNNPVLGFGSIIWWRVLAVNSAGETENTGSWRKFTVVTARIDQIQLNRVPAVTRQNVQGATALLVASFPDPAYDPIPLGVLVRIYNPADISFDGKIMINKYISPPPNSITTPGGLYDHSDPFTIPPKSYKDCYLKFALPSAELGSWAIEVALRQGTLMTTEVDKKNVSVEVREFEQPTVEPPQGKPLSYLMGKLAFSPSESLQNEATANLVQQVATFLNLLCELAPECEGDTMFSPYADYIAASEEMRQRFRDTLWTNLNKAEDLGSEKVFHLNWTIVPIIGYPGVNVSYDRATILLTVPDVIEIIDADGGEVVIDSENKEKKLIWLVHGVDKQINQETNYSGWQKHDINIKINDMRCASYLLKAYITLEIGPFQGNIGSEYSSIDSAPWIYNYSKWQKNPEEMYWYILNDNSCSLQVNNDTDNDGLPDSWEMKFFGNTNYGANDDPDHDGYSNYAEYVAGTNPMNLSVTITVPTSNSTYPTTSSTVSLGGTTWGNIGVTEVTWSNNRGGSGTASGTTSWITNGIGLQNGDNVITVTARDAAGTTGTDTITVIYTPPDTTTTAATTTIATTTTTSATTTAATTTTLSTTSTAATTTAATTTNMTTTTSGTSTTTNASTTVASTTTSATTTSTSATTTAISLTPDMLMQSFSVMPKSVHWGDVITWSGTVKNQGSGKSPPFSVRVYLSADATINQFDYVNPDGFDGVTVPGLESGAIYIISSRQYTLPSSPLAGFNETGTYYFGTIIDIGNGVPESDESNNSNLGQDVDQEQVQFVSQTETTTTSATTTTLPTTTTAAITTSMTTTTNGTSTTTNATTTAASTTTAATTTSSTTITTTTSGSTSTTAGILLIKKCTVIAGKYINEDKISVSGIVDVDSADLIGASDVNVRIGNVYEESIDTSLFKAKNGKYIYSYILSRDEQGGITSLIIDTNKQTFTLKAQKVDLTGLHCPFEIEFEIGNYWGACNVDEDIVNGKKFIPVQLMTGVEDYLQVQSVKVKKGKLTDTLTAKGGIAYKILPTSMSNVVLILEGQTFTIPAVNFKLSGKSGLKYVCKNAKISEGGIANGTFDFGKCTFSINIKNTRINTTTGIVGVTLTIGSFDEQVNFDMGG